MAVAIPVPVGSTNCRRCSGQIQEQSQFLLCQLCVFDASYSHLLRTNAVPSPYEQKILQQQRIAQLKSALSEMNNQGSDQGIQVGPQSKRLRQYESATSPIRCLPDEIWTNVFKYVAQKDELNKIKVVLSQVCLRWRTIIFTNPSFWNDITLNDESMDRAEEFLAKTGTTTPITLYVRLSAWKARQISLDWLTEYIPRLRRITFYEAIPAKFPFSVPFQELRTLEFDSTRSEYYDDGMVLHHNTRRPKPPIIAGTITAPGLRTLIFDQISDPCSYPISWGGLSTLKIGHSSSVSYEALMNALQPASTTLETICLSFRSHFEGHDNHTTPSFIKLAFPKLTYLTINLAANRDSIWLLDSFTTPSLRLIGLGHVSASTWSQQVYTLMQRSFCSPLEAHVTYSDFDNRFDPSAQNNNCITEVLSSLPSISTIRVRTHVRARDCIRQLYTALRSPSFISSSPLTHKILYPRPPAEPEDVPMEGATAESGSSEPTVVVVARALTNLDSLHPVEKVKDLESIFEDSIIDGLQRVDIYIR